MRSLPAMSCMQMKVNNATCSMQQYSASTDSIYTTNTHHVHIDGNWINYNLSRSIKQRPMFSKQMSPKQLKRQKPDKKNINRKDLLIILPIVNCMVRGFFFPPVWRVTIKSLKWKNMLKFSSLKGFTLGEKRKRC